MKAHKLIIAVVLLGVNALTLAICQAADDGAKAGRAPKDKVALPASAGKAVQPKGNKSMIVQETSTNVLTGSYLPHKMKRVGRVTDGPGNVVVIDRADIQRSGAATVAQVLAKVPGLSVGGR